MDCLKIEEYLMRYMDSTLTEKEALELQKHVKDCSNCREEFLAYDSMMTAFRETKLCEAPVDFEERVMIEIRTLEPINKKTESVLESAFWMVWGSASVLLGIGFMLALYKDSILNYLGQQTALSNLLQIVTPISERLSEVVNVIITNLNYWLATVAAYLNSYKIYIVVLFAVSSLVLYFVRRRANQKN